jgi:molybdopterin converting factor small subunit
MRNPGKMTVNVLFFAHLRDLAGAGKRTYVLGEGATVEDLANLLADEDSRFNGLLRYARPTVNAEWATGATVLRDGDETGFLPPSSGG